MTAQSHAAGRTPPKWGGGTRQTADGHTGPRIGSLFSGAGGLDMAVKAVFGGEVIWHSEIDPAASKVLAHHWPDVPNLCDITAIDWDAVPPVDVLCGGFPCTDVSAAGKRAGMHGTRSGLWSHMAEAIDVLRPQYVVIENVRGLLNADANRPMEPDQDGVGNGTDRPVLRAIGAVLGDLADIGTYDARWVTLAASAIGAPHRRERVFIFATQDGANCAGPSQHELLSTPQSRDYKGRPADDFNQANLCRDVAITEQWGKYLPAIARWESLTRPAPAPTEPNKNGNPRLAAAFSEWMMGWPAGHVTDPAIGISRNDQLRIVGNGVCPQQATAALRYLMGVATGVDTHTHTGGDVTALLPTPRAQEPGRTNDGYGNGLAETVERLLPGLNQ